LPTAIERQRPAFWPHRLTIINCTNYYYALLDLQQICSNISPFGCSRRPVSGGSTRCPGPLIKAHTRPAPLHLDLIFGRKMPYEYGKLWSRTSQQCRLSPSRSSLSTEVERAHRAAGRPRRVCSSMLPPYQRQRRAPSPAVDRDQGAVGVLAEIPAG
jgi:hypothetical protein